jgi:hypothetical protein
MNQTHKLKIFSAIFLSAFICFEYIFISRIESISSYALYVAEVFWVTAVLLVLKKIEWFKNIRSIRWLSLSMLMGFLGAGVHFLARQLGLLVPFDFQSTEVTAFLLLVGPVLEEFLFHGALFRLFEVFIPKKWIIVLITALIFSFGHYQVIDQVPESIHAFVQYQAFYTFLLGTICGVFRVKYGLLVAVLAHLFFNFGFWCVKFLEK